VKRGGRKREHRVWIEVGVANCHDAKYIYARYILARYKSPVGAVYDQSCSLNLRKTGAHRAPLQ
jgi:hypothetical protein